MSLWHDIGKFGRGVLRTVGNVVPSLVPGGTLLQKAISLANPTGYKQPPPTAVARKGNATIDESRGSAQLPAHSSAVDEAFARTRARKRPGKKKGGVTKK
jgi:hypothetical protein